MRSLPTRLSCRYRNVKTAHRHRSTMAATTLPELGLPGFDIKFKDVSFDKQHTFPSALLGHVYVDFPKSQPKKYIQQVARKLTVSDTRRGPLLTIREYTMLQVMNRITDKHKWNIKIFDKNITQKWRDEAVGIEGRDISEKMMNYVSRSHTGFVDASLCSSRNFCDIQWLLYKPGFAFPFTE